MDGVKAQVAQSALGSLPPGAVGVVSSEQLLDEAGGHAFGGGVHVGWSWGVDDSRGVYLDFLWEHRMAGITAGRFWQDGEREGIAVPAEFRLTSRDSDKDARLDREYVEYNGRAYADLRQRGLLPPAGRNVGSQDINEHLRTGGSDDR